MSYGFTGLILRVWAETGRGNTVQIMISESYETHDMITAKDRRGPRHRLPSKFRAQLYAARINAGQLDRYRGSKYATNLTARGAT